jgi:hypothetical protein
MVANGNRSARFVGGKQTIVNDGIGDDSKPIAIANIRRNDQTATLKDAGIVVGIAGIHCSSTLRQHHILLKWQIDFYIILLLRCLASNQYLCINRLGCHLQSVGRRRAIEHKRIANTDHTQRIHFAHVEL